MRQLALPIVLALAVALALGFVMLGDRHDGVKFIDDLGRNARRLDCVAQPAPLSGQVAELRATDHGQLIAVFPDERTVAVLDDQLRVRWSTVFDKVGPRGVAVPISAAFVDSVLFVVDQQQPKLRRFGSNGNVLPDVRLDFIPYRLDVLGGTLVIAPAVMGRYPSSLIFTLANERLVPVAVSPQDYANVTVKMLGNMMMTSVLGNELLLAHQFMTPRTYLWRAGSAPRQVPTLLPKETARAIGYVPPLPLDEAALKPLLTIAIAASADPIARRFLMLTRSGRMVGDRFEKAIIRTDSAFNFIDAFVLPVSAGHMAYLASRKRAVVIDDEDGWYTCPIS